MKPGPVTKLDKKNKTPSKKPDDDIMSANCDAIVIFPIYQQSGSRILDAQHVKLIFSLVGTFCLTKTENRTKKSLI